MDNLTPRQKQIQEQFWSSNEFVILDTETNGMDPEVHGPCEVAMLTMVNGVSQPPHSWFIKTNIPIPPHVQAVHHITNDDIADAPKMAEMEKTFQDFCRGKIIVAHNAPFDYGMMKCLQGPQFKWVDNLRVARHAWPLGTASPATGHPLPAHKNKILQHWLDLQVDTMGQAAHRAQADILVTAEVFKVGVNAWLSTLDHVPTFKEFAAYLDSPCKVSTMNFGPYKDKDIEQVPTATLRQLLNQHRSGTMDLGVDLHWTLNEEYTRRTAHLSPEEQAANAEVEKQRAAMQAIVNKPFGSNPQP